MLDFFLLVLNGEVSLRLAGRGKEEIISLTLKSNDDVLFSALSLDVLTELSRVHKQTSR